MSATSRIARNTGLQVGGEAASKVASLALYVFMARSLGREGFGDFVFALSLALLLTTLADLGTDAVITRELARSRERLHDHFFNAIAIKIVFGLLGVALAIVVVSLGGYPPEVRVAATVLAFAVLIELLSKTVFAAFRGYEDMGPIALTLIIQRTFTAALGILAILLGAGVVAVAWVYLAGAIVALVFSYRSFGRRASRPRLEFSSSAARWLAITSIPIGLSGVFNMVLFRVDATMLSLIKGNVEVGLYGAAYRLLESTLFLSYAFVAATVPMLSRLRRTTTPSVAEAYETSCKIIASTLLPIGTAFALFATPITLTIYGSEFAASAPAVRLLGGAAALYGFSYLSAYVLLSQDRQRVIPWVTGVVMVENVVLNLIFIPRYSYLGAAAVTTVSELTMMLLMGAMALRTTGRISVRRIAPGPILGCLAMAGVAVVLGEGLVGLGVALVAYALVLFVVEWRLWPDDVKTLLDSVLRRRVTT